MTGRAQSTEVDIDSHRNFDLIYKVLIIGDSSVGKTALLTRFCEGRFQSSFMSTVGKVTRYEILILRIVASKSQPLKEGWSPISCNTFNRCQYRSQCYSLELEPLHVEEEFHSATTVQPMCYGML